MGIFFLGILAVLIGLVVICITKRGEAALAILGGIIVVAVSFVTSVPTGYTGIVTTFGKVEDYTLDAGFNFKSPWQDVVLIDNREQKMTFSVQAFSADIQQVDLSGSINYSVDKGNAMNLYRTVGKSYGDILVTPRLYENIKAVFSHYSAEALVAERNKLSDEILVLMKNDLAEYGLHIISVSIENIDFTDAFTDAVEAKQVATQTLQRAQTEEQQKTMEAQQAAERQKIAAQAQADVAKIQADAEAYTISAKAEAEANANKEIAESLTPSLIEYVQAQNWDGKLPTTMVGGSDSLPVLTLDTGKAGE